MHADRLRSPLRNVALWVFGCLFSLLAVWPNAPAHAQDAHYWAIQYGNRARLLGGAVIGSIDGIAAVYYNPGALALLANKQLVLAGNVIQWNSVTVENALGGESDLSSSRVTGVPSLFAGEFNFGFLKNDRLAYSFLTRQSFNTRIEAQGVAFDLSDESIELDILSGSLSIDQNMGEYWAGLTWATPVGSNFGFGFSPFLAVRNQRVRNQLILQGQNTVSGEVRSAIALAGESFKYENYRLLGKFGLAWTSGDWRLGVNVTTPSVSVFGSGSIGFDQSIVTQDLDDDGTAESQIVSNFQDEVPATYKSPLSVGGGAAYAFGGSRIHVSVEWFDNVPEYTIMDSEPFFDRQTGDEYSSDVTIVAQSVTNVAIGLEHNFSEKTAMDLSFRTDKSTLPSDDRVHAVVSSWDLKHIAGGVSWSFGRSDFTLGGVYAWGSDTRPVSGTGDDDFDNSIGLPPDTEVTARTLTIILGYKIDF